MATCRSCGAEVEWVVLKSGKRNPLDPDPVDGGNIRVTGTHTDEQGRTSPLAEYVGNGKGDRVSHFATCPNAAQHRRK